MLLKNVFTKAVALVRESPFLRHNTVFFLGSLGVAALNYLYYPLLGRMLSPTYFGEVQVLLSLFFQAAIFMSIITYVTIHVTVNSKSEQERNGRLVAIERLAYMVGFSLLLLMLLGTPMLRDFLQFGEAWPFVALIVSLAISIPLAFRMAFLRGKRMFLKASLTDGIGSLSKLLFSAVLVVVGWQAFGAVAGLALSQVLSLAYGVRWARRAGFVGFGVKTQTITRLKDLKPQLHYALAVFVASFCVTALLSLDILAIKHFFSPEEAGLYAGITTIARIIFFVIAPFTGVLLTMVSAQQSRHKNALQLSGTLGLMLLVGGIALVLIVLLPNVFVRVLVGAKYLAYVELLPRLGLALLLLALANALVMYQVALQQYGAVILAIIAFLGSLALVYYRHDTVGDVVNAVLYGAGGLLVMALGFTARVSVRHIKEANG